MSVTLKPSIVFYKDNECYCTCTHTNLAATSLRHEVGREREKIATSVSGDAKLMENVYVTRGHFD